MQIIFAKIITVITSILISLGVIAPPVSSPVFLPVKLVPVNETSTAMIDRRGAVESYNEGYSVATNVYNYGTPSIEKAESFYDEWTVYGLTENLTVDDLLTNYVKVQGDGYAKVTASTGNVVGTGSVIKVFDRKGTETTDDDVMVEQFTVIIYTDLNGDAKVDESDLPIIAREVSGLTWWSIPDFEEYRSYMLKAADLHDDGIIDGLDVSTLSQYLRGECTINQITGKAVY